MISRAARGRARSARVAPAAEGSDYGGRGLRHGGDGEIEQKGCAAPRLARDRDVAAALLHDAVDDRQAEAGALALFLGREERLEEPGARLLVHALAGVADAQPRVLPGAP